MPAGEKAPAANVLQQPSLGRNVVFGRFVIQMARIGSSSAYRARVQ